MGTILVGYDTETAAVGEAISLFTESPNFPLYAKALDPDTVWFAHATEPWRKPR